MTRYIDQLNVFSATPVTGDYALGYQASAGAADKDRKIPLDWFGYLSKAQTWTNTQTITPSATNLNGLLVNMPASNSAYALVAQYNSVTRVYTEVTSIRSQLVFSNFDNGTDVGPIVNIGRNNNASTPGAGFMYVAARSGTQYAIWPDNSGNLRIGTSLPTSANDTTGTVVGTQTSSLDSKNISEALPSLSESFAAILEAALTGLRTWSYKSGAFNGELFPCGLVTDFAPRYGMDRDAAHPNGKSLNIPVAIGDLIASISILHERITALEGA